MGKEAYKFVDFLKSAKQKCWQILPIGPTSYGDSPYQSFSTNAGNPYFIDMDILREEGLLKKSDYSKPVSYTHLGYAFACCICACVIFEVCGGMYCVTCCVVWGDNLAYDCLLHYNKSHY